MDQGAINKASTSPRSAVGAGLAAISGVFAALAGACGKLASSKISATASASAEMGGIPDHFDSAFAGLGFAVLLVACNVLMWFAFSKALVLSPSSLEPTGINTAANLAASGVLGRLLFDETVPSAWWVGISVVGVGMVLVNDDLAGNGGGGGGGGSGGTNATRAAATRAAATGGKAPARVSVTVSGGEGITLAGGKDKAS